MIPPFRNHRFKRFGTAFIFTLVLSSFALAETPAKLDPDAVLYPRETLVGDQSATSTPAPTSSPTIIIAGVILLATGAWLWWKFRVGPAGLMARTPSHLAIEETRALGNRQFLLVVSHEKRRFMLGVCPGRLEMLTELSPASAEKSDS